MRSLYRSLESLNEAANVNNSQRANIINEAFFSPMSSSLHYQMTFLLPLILTVMKPPFRFNQVDKTPTKVTGPDGIPSRLSRNP